MTQDTRTGKQSGKFALTCTWDKCPERTGGVCNATERIAETRNDFSDFMLNASKEEKERVFREVARKVNEEQKRLYEKVTGKAELTDDGMPIETISHPRNTFLGMSLLIEAYCPSITTKELYELTVAILKEFARERQKVVEEVLMELEEMETIQVTDGEHAELLTDGYKHALEELKEKIRKEMK